jgi:hypothetical protein
MARPVQCQFKGKDKVRGWQWQFKGKEKSGWMARAVQGQFKGKDEVKGDGKGSSRAM